MAAAAALATPALYPAFFFVLEKAVKGAGNAVIPTYPTHWSHGLQGSLKRCYKHPFPTSINGYHTAKKLLSQSPAKRPTFAFTSESGYTLGFRRRIAHSGLHAETGGVLGGGCCHYPRTVPHVHKHPRAGYQNGKLCRFWALVEGAPEERREPAGQRCAYARRCSEASRPRWAA